jgi:hypothetical protein
MGRAGIKGKKLVRDTYDHNSRKARHNATVSENVPSVPDFPRFLTASKPSAIVCQRRSLVFQESVLGDA